MKMEDMILVSVDDHIVEPPDMFDQVLPAKYKDQAPKVIHKNDGTDVWSWLGKEIPNVGLNAVAGRRPEEYGMEPTAFTQIREGAYNVDKRVDDMNVNGVLGSLNFGSFPGFHGSLFLECEDKALAKVILQAYNDWHVDVWCGSHPGRFIPCSLPAMWDVNVLVEEVKRLEKKGCYTISIPNNPASMGLPSLHTDHWDPFWQVCNDLGIVICMHLGGAPIAASPDSPVDSFIANMPIALYSNASDLLFSPILRKYKDIKFALTEGGAGWIPYFLERVDYVYKHHRAWTFQDFGDKLPSEVFQEHVYTCFIDDRTAIKMRYDCGIDNMQWECDYPHSDSTWPNTPEVLWETVKDIPDEDIHKITWENACRAYRFDPFAHMPKEEGTVGGLRAKATHVDTSYLDTGGAGKAPTEKQGVIVRVSDIGRQLAGAKE